MQKTTETPTIPPAQADGSALGRYALVREVGRGAMSVVHEARHTGTGQTVAVKVLAAPPGLTPQQAQDMRARFMREARAMAGLSHPNVVAIHGLGEQDNDLFLVMEYLRGETLRQRLGRGPLAPAQALPVLRQVADALDAVHARGVVHRDVKPSNVMLLPDGTAKLLDFGLARQSDDATLTSASALVGSPAYMAPEQVRGEAGTPASDVWALGALLYEALAGHPPFAGTSIPSVLYRVTHEDAPPVAGLDPPVQRVLRRALAKNPARRYPSARALAEALAAAASPRPQRAPTRPGRAAIAVPAVVVLLGLAALLLRPHTHRQAPAVSQFPAPSAKQAPAAPPALAARPAAAARAGTVARVVTSPRTAKAVTARAVPPPHSQGGAHKTRLAVKPHPAVTRPHARLAAVPRPAPPVRHAPRRSAPQRRVAAAARASRRRSVILQRLAESRQTRRARPSARHRKGDSFDRYASLRLQKFIWPVGR